MIKQSDIVVGAFFTSIYCNIYISMLITGITDEGYTYIYCGEDEISKQEGVMNTERMLSYLIDMGYKLGYSDDILALGILE